MGNEKRITQIQTTETFKESGEVLKSETIKTFTVKTEPDFIKVYLNTIMFLTDIPQGVGAVLKCILQNSSWADNNQQMVIITNPIRAMIAKKLGKSKQYVADSITNLVKGKILYRIGSSRSGCYQVNPHLFGKGRWEDIKKLQLHIDFEAEGTTFWTEVQNSKKVKDIETFQHLIDLEKSESD